MEINYEVSRFGVGGASQIHLLSLLVVIVAALLVLVLPRRYVIVPLLLPIVLIPIGEGIAIGPMHFPVLRMMIFFGWIRVLRLRLAGDANGRTSPIDRLVLIWTIVSSVAFCVLWQSQEAVIGRLGQVYSALGVYFLLRFLIRDRGDVDRVFQVFAIVCTIAAVPMTIEQLTGRNAFAQLGGVAEFSPIRDGRLRSQGPFLHPILAGTFGATLVAPFLGFLLQRGRRTAGGLGALSASVMAITSASSTALMAGIAGIVGLCLWPMRNHMRLIRWGILATLVGLHMVMKAPVWALIGRLQLVGGSTSYHRYELIDQFIHRFSEWWLVGVKGTSDWGYFMGDTANQYVDTGVTGGLVSLVLFLAIISVAFGRIGFARKAAEGDAGTELQVWVLGAALLSHTVGFFGIVYFDQTIVSWYALLAIVAATTAEAREVRDSNSQGAIVFRREAVRLVGRPRLQNRRAAGG